MLSRFGKFVRKFKDNVKAQLGAGGLLTGIVGLSVGLYVAAAIVPGAIVDITNETLWTGAPSAVITLGTTVLGIVAVVSLIMLMLKRNQD